MALRERFRYVRYVSDYHFDYSRILLMLIVKLALKGKESACNLMSPLIWVNRRREPRCHVHMITRMYNLPSKWRF
jgi:hypothetical protein